MSDKKLERCLGYSILFIFCLIGIVYFFSIGDYIVAISIISIVLIYIFCCIIYKIKLKKMCENNNVIQPIESDSNNDNIIQSSESENNNIILPLESESENNSIIQSSESKKKITINIIPENNVSIENYIQKKIKINYDIKFLSIKKKINKFNICYICLEDINENYSVSVSSCDNHLLHIECLIKYVNNFYNKCGICGI